MSKKSEELAKQQITTGNRYNFHSPDQRIMLAFLQARTDQLENATKTINGLTLDNSLRETLMGTLWTDIFGVDHDPSKRRSKF